MINQERVCEMTKLAAYEQHEGKKYRQTQRFFRSDFVARQLLIAFISGTAAFALLFLMWGVCNLTQLIAQLDKMDIVAFAVSVIVKYAVFLLVYLVAVDIYANMFYAAGRKNTKRYYKGLKYLGRLYDEQEGRMVPGQKEKQDVRG